MIRLAADYSQPLLTHLDGSAGIVDAVKVSEFDRDQYVRDYAGLVSRGIPLVVHGLGQNVTPGTPSFLAEFDPVKLELAISVCRPAYLSAHLEWRSSAVFPGAAAFLRALCRDISVIRELSGLPVHLENIFHYHTLDPEPDRANFNPPVVGDPEFICEAVGRTGTGFLLDLGHAQVAAWHRGEDVEDYVKRLPLAAVEEIHISGPAIVGGALRDRHHEVSAEGYALLTTALRQCSAGTVSLEYGGVGPAFENKSDPVTLLRQLVELRKATTATAKQ